MESVYKNDIGTRLEFYIEDDISSLKSAKILVQKPKSKTEWTNTNYDSTNNMIYYISQENDFDEVGVYKLQVYLELDDWKGSTDPVKMFVADTV